MTSEIPRRPLLTWAVAAGLVVALVVLTVLGVQRWTGREDLSLADAPVSRGEAVARGFFTLDYRSIDADLARVDDAATGDFKAQYAKRSAQLRTAVTSKKLVLTASVPESGTAVEYYDGHEAWVLVAVDVHTESAGSAALDDRHRIRAVLVKHGNRWLVSRLEQVG